MVPFWIYILANLGLFSLIRFVTSFFSLLVVNIYATKRFFLQAIWWCSGSACIVVNGSISGKIFISCPVECMNSYNIWIHIYDEFSMNSYIFCTLYVWIHTNKNSYYVDLGRQANLKESRESKELAELRLHVLVVVIANDACESKKEIMRLREWSTR